MTRYLSLLVLMAFLINPSFGQGFVGYEEIKSTPFEIRGKKDLLTGFFVKKESNLLIVSIGFRPTEHTVFDIETLDMLYSFETPGFTFNYCFLEGRQSKDVLIEKNGKLVFSYDPNSQEVSKQKKNELPGITCEQGQSYEIHSTYLYDRQYASIDEWMMFEIRNHNEIIFYKRVSN